MKYILALSVQLISNIGFLLFAVSKAPKPIKIAALCPHSLFNVAVLWTITTI